MSDIEMINSPKHYNDESGVECCEVTDFMMFNGGNCFKYLYRCGSKFDDIEDLKKAKWYAERAWIMGDVVNTEAMNGIEKIYKHRTGNILNAMKAVEVSLWMIAENFINDEIERLESE